MWEVVPISSQDEHVVVSLEENLKKALTEMMVLHLLSTKEYYIGELTAAIRDKSHRVLNIVFPYAAIYRLLDEGYIREVKKRIAPDGRRRQYYVITEDGRDYLAQLLFTYQRFSKGVADIMAEGGKPE